MYNLSRPTGGTLKVHTKSFCLQAMAVVYGRHWKDMTFLDTSYILAMLVRTVDRLDLFISKRIKMQKENVVDVLKASGLCRIASLHQQGRAVPQPRPRPSKGP